MGRADGDATLFVAAEHNRPMQPATLQTTAASWVIHANVVVVSSKAIGCAGVMKCVEDSTCDGGSGARPINSHFRLPARYLQPPTSNSKTPNIDQRYSPLDTRTYRLSSAILCCSATPLTRIDWLMPIHHTMLAIVNRVLQ